MGKEAEAKAYIQKIRHESLRISVIQRLEEYLAQNSLSNAKNVKDQNEEDDSDDDEDENRSRKPSPEPQIGMWVDQTKHLFLWYYDIYLVPHPTPLLFSLYY